jgi:hypothetical protein
VRAFLLAAVSEELFTRQIADTVEPQWAERQFTVVLRTVKIVDHLILPTGGCLLDLENRGAQLGTLTSARDPAAP